MKLRQQRLHHASMHVREPEIAALEAISQLSVVDAEAMEQRCLQVMD